jgi:hypothetical protein
VAKGDGFLIQAIILRSVINELQKALSVSLAYFNARVRSVKFFNFGPWQRFRSKSTLVISVSALDVLLAPWVGLAYGFHGPNRFESRVGNL